MAVLRGNLPEAVNWMALVALIAATVAAGHFLNAWIDPIAALRDAVNRAGSVGPLLFVVSFLALNTAGVPMPMLGASAGLVFGPISGTMTLLAAMTFTACAQFLLARHVVGERIRGRLAHAMERVDRLLARRGVAAVAAARLLPGPFSEFNMLAGLTSLAFRDFMIGTIVGCLPKAAVWSGLGALLFRGT